METHRLLNLLVLLAVCGRAVWWAAPLAQHHIVPLLNWVSAAPPVGAKTQSDTDTALQRTLRSALRRCNASVVNALLGDAVAYGTQNRYHHDGFAVPASGLTIDGLAFRDLTSAAHEIVVATPGMDSKPELGNQDAVAENRVGLNTKYGNHLMMTLRLIFPSPDGPAIVDFEAFQYAWHQWQLSVNPQDRGNAAEIALKNLERGLIGRDAATLVGDLGATPRLPGLVVAFALDVCQHLLSIHGTDAKTQLLQETEERLSQAALEITMATHDRAEALVMSEFLARVTFRLVFQEILLPPTAEWHPLDRHTAPSTFWRAVRSVRKTMGGLFLRQAYIDAEHLCMRQAKRKPLGGELGGTRHLDHEGDLDDLATHHTQQLPTPQSSDRQRELFGLSGGINAALPAILYLAWKYERHPAAALTANALLGGNAAGRGVVLGMLLGARAGNGASTPRSWVSQLQSAPKLMQMLGALSVARLGNPEAHLSYTPCPAALCNTEGKSSSVVTSRDVQISASMASSGRQGEGRVGERYVVVELNVTNIGVTGMPICLYGKLWLLWEASGFARGRFRSIGDPSSTGVINVADQCLGPREWRLLAINVSTSEPEAFTPGLQHMVGLLEILRPLGGVGISSRMQQPGAGNLIHAVVVQGRPEEACEHFAAKVGRFEIPPV